ncbi:hypothetical protein AVEN_20602-1 [Araneus ventricosus]|uniref:Uncharacterized protein n=1 Tax=Araneus ventricosus TaxID=182803 RepID=A0A4Y2VEY4_ARAVE|nr:hypothetical protein AVEN_20602-1 [Araneus ventricosus]
MSIRIVCLCVVGWQKKWRECRGQIESFFGSICPLLSPRFLCRVITDLGGLRIMKDICKLANETGRMQRQIEFSLAVLVSAFSPFFFVSIHHQPRWLDNYERHGHFNIHTYGELSKSFAMQFIGLNVMDDTFKMKGSCRRVSPQRR